jgi:hypothetical protein
MTLDDLGGRLFASIPEAARVLGWSEHTVRQGVADGSIPWVPAGSHKRVRMSWLRQMAGSPEPAPEVTDEAGQQRQAMDLLRSAVQQRVDAFGATDIHLARLLDGLAGNAFGLIERLLRLDPAS